MQIYSVVNGVAHVVICTKNANINEVLLEKELADCCEENYMSKVRRKSENEKKTKCFARDYILRI